MRHIKPLALLLPALLAACASTPEATIVPPDFTPLTTEVARPHARLYADCIAQAAEAGRYRQFIDGGEELVLFTCNGAIARTFYDALARHSAAIGSEFTHEGRTVRSTTKIQRNLIGVDYCAANADGEHECVITFNAGDFLLAAS